MLDPQMKRGLLEICILANKQALTPHPSASRLTGFSSRGSLLTAWRDVVENPGGSDDPPGFLRIHIFSGAETPRTVRAAAMTLPAALHRARRAFWTSGSAPRMRQAL